MKSILKYFILLYLLLILLVNNISAAQFLVHTYNQEDGMPNSNVNSITQDSSGRIWAVTRRGITSYDGYTWKRYMVLNRAGQELENTFYIKNDESNNLWVAQLDDSLRVFKFNNGNYYSKSNISVYISKNNSNKNCRTHLNNTNNKFTFAAVIPTKGLYVLTNNRWSTYNSANGISDLDFLSVYTIKETVYFSNKTGLYKIENGKISPELSKNYFGEKQLVLALTKTRNNSSDRLWILTNKQIGYVEQGEFKTIVKNVNIDFDNKQRYFSLVPNYFNSIIWSSQFKINKYNYSNGKIEEIRDVNGLIDDGCSEMFIDRESILWIASFRGISKISSMRFKSIFKHNGLLENEVSAIIEQSPGKYILGHNNGITICQGDEYKKIRFNREYLYERVNYLVKDRNGNVWASAYKNGIAKIDKNNNITWLSCDRLGIDEVNGLAIDKNDRLFCSNKNNVYELVSGKLKKINFNDNRITHIRGIYFDQNNALYITTSVSGLFRYRNNKLEQLSSKDKDSTKAKNVFSVFQDTDGILLVGTEAGLFKVDSNKLIRTGLNDKALNRFIYFITKDKNGNYWFGTEMGLVRLKNNFYWNYGVREGLAGLETNRAAGIIDSYGRLLIGTNRGLSIYFSEYDVNRSIKPLVQLLNAEAEGKIYSLAQPLQITSNTVNFVINYSVISYYDERKNSLKYKLEGNGESVDADWQELKNIEKNYIQYKDLKPGTYVFKIRAKNALGVWSEEIVSAQIKITSPFNFLYLLSLIPLTLLVIVAYMRKNSQNKKYGLELEKEVEQRTAQLANSEKRYKQMFSENNAIMLIINPDTGYLIDANPSAVVFFDLDKEELLKKNIFEFKSPQMIDKDLAIQLLNSSKEISIDYSKDNTQEIRHLKAHLSEIEGDGKKLLYCIIDDTTDQVNAEKQLLEMNENLESIVKNRTSELEEALDILHQEITQRMEAEEGLIITKNELEKSLIREKELNQLKSRFIMMVSHEYRTPLTVIFSSAELIKEFAKIGHIEACLDYAKRIQESVKTLTELLEGVMAVGEETEVKVFKEEFNYQEFLTYVINDINSKTKSSHNIVIEGIEDAINICQDRNLLKQVISQVVSNSIKFSDKAKSIIISNKFVKEKLIISIKDFGCGISEKDIEYIFEPFYKCQDAVGIISGTGLGLAIVKKNVQALGGNILAESELKQGTSIFIELPIK